MHTRLILFDGILGTGKSSLSEWSAQWLREQGLTTQWSGESPLYRTRFASFWTAFQARDAQLNAVLVETWRQIADEIFRTDEIFILDGALSNLSFNLLLAANLPPEDLEQTVREVGAILLPYQPLLVYLSGNTKAILERTIQARGDRWAEAVTTLFNGLPYQRVRERRGIEGLIAFLQDAQDLLDQTLPRLLWPVVSIDTTAGAWDGYQQTLVEQLALLATSR